VDHILYMYQIYVNLTGNNASLTPVLRYYTVSNQHIYMVAQKSKPLPSHQ